MFIGGRANQAVSQTTRGINTDMGLHANVPLVALLGLVHLGVLLRLLVFDRARRLDKGGIGQRALEHHDTRL
ncbi:hypothetical protein D3C78_1938890 [compost metagenome]